ncbi:diadenylate cyclase [Candidatus Poriferisodalis sp.]|uniref:diadenylate cyclase n=1 Tax=Candidatus Poriferisodalis sp. TaxID=3101277 RepID=UPI003B02A110
MPNDLLSIMNNSTAHAYERTEASAPLHIVNSRDGGYELRVPLETPISLGYSRALRKLLEASDSDLAVIADEGCVLGLGGVSLQTLSLDIEVRGKLDWSLSVEGTTLLRSYAGEVSFPRRPLERVDLADVAARTIGQCDMDRIWHFVEAARDSDHGMTLVVSSDAASEAQRLGSAAFVLEPCDLDDADVQRLGAVDGAVLIDPEGRCHAFGIILDGEASGQGDPARGSRYNSAVRYQRAHPDTSFIVVVSVDGNVNLLPALRPRVSRAEVAAAVDRFCDICAQDEPDGEDYAEAHHLVRDFAFYLDADQCERVNQADEQEQQRRLDAGGIAARGPLLRPDPEMNDSYFHPDEPS